MCEMYARRARIQFQSNVFAFKGCCKIEGGGRRGGKRYLYAGGVNVTFPIVFRNNLSS